MAIGEAQEPENKAKLEGEVEGEGLTPDNSPAESQQPEVSLNDSVHPGDSNEATVATTESVSTGGDAEQFTMNSSNLSPLPAEIEELGIDPNIGIDEVFEQVTFTGLGGTALDAVREQGKGGVLSVATSNPIHAEIDSRPSAAALLQNSLHFRDIALAKSDHLKHAFDGASQAAVAVVEEKVLDGLFEPAGSNYKVDPKYQSRRFLGVESRMGEQSFASLDPDLQRTRALAASVMNPTSTKELPEFPSMGNSNDPDFTVGPDRKVDRMAPNVMPQLFEGGNSVVVLGAGGERRRVNKVLLSSEASNLWNSESGENYRVFKADMTEALAA